MDKKYYHFPVLNYKTWNFQKFSIAFNCSMIALFIEQRYGRILKYAWKYIIEEK